MSVTRKWETDPRVRRCETGQRQADGCTEFCQLDHGHDGYHVYGVHLAHPPQPPMDVGDILALRQQRGDAYALDAAIDTIGKLRRHLKGLQAFEKSVNEALNSGDGVYRP